ncbi:immunoglobulin gamma-1 heavy chain-like isoform X2 [Dermochelys coriacea]|uniref:immunoglobulin gamma-1 heavy chain-like isoform X2 n=1 Tax=Dermochelys coriacea TaxID=27794 RepID=UPI001CA852C2|nr:immunoglobulin gamma-1 heavy chain-like isoform X2 [Dermochelys coriacea]
MTEESQKMSYQIVWVILFCLQMTASQKGILIQQSPAQIFLASGETAQIDCKLSTGGQYIYWYKELQNGSLHGIYQSYKFAATPHEKYSSTVNSEANKFTLIISNVQRNDSGVYYCGLAAYIHPNFGNGTRLIVTDASEPSLSILVPSNSEYAELPPVIPLLCLLSDFTPPWSAVLWDTGEEASDGQTDAGAIDGNGVFSVWSLMTIPSEKWNQKTICTCTAKNSTGTSINATVSKETDEARKKKLQLCVICWAVLYFHPCRHPAADPALQKVSNQRETCANRESNTYEAHSTDRVCSCEVQEMKSPFLTDTV